MRTHLLMLVVVMGLVACATTGQVGTPGGLSQPTKESRRAQLYPKVSEYLTETAALEPPLPNPQLDFPTSGTLPGWIDKVCPQVTGLPGEEGEFIRARVAQIALAAGVRMGARHCRPNLEVFLTNRPKELLGSMEQRNSFYMFGPRGRPYLLDQFIATTRPVRVWYNMSISYKYAFTRVLVIVDSTRLQGVSRDQLADYIALVSLAEIKPLAQIKPVPDLADVPTILNLFAGAPQAAPAGLTDWDQAFLKSLYRNSWAIPWRRKLGEVDPLALSMVSEIVP